MVRGFAADTTGQGDAHRPASTRPWVRPRCGASAGRPPPGFEQADRLLQRAGNQATEFRQGFPLGVPETEAALVFLRHRREQGRDQPRRTGGGGDQHRAAHRVARGMVEEPPRPAPAGSRFAGLGLHQQADIATELAEATGHQAEHAGEPTRRSRWVCQGCSGSQAQLGQRRGHRRFAERGERPRGAAELQHQQARAQLAQALAVPGQGASRPANHAQVTGACCNQVRPASGVSACRSAWSARTRQDVADPARARRAAQLQHQAAVHGVLAGGAEMHVALGLGVASRHLAAQRLDQRDRRVAGSGDRLGQRQRVVSSARQAASIGATAVAGTTPVRASARARAASKYLCRRPRSENTARAAVK